MKRKFTKIVAVLLALLMLPSVSLYSAVDFSGIFSFKAKASGSEFLKSGFCGDTSDGTDGKNLSWVLDDDGTLTITGTGKMAEKAFNYDLRIKNVIIGEGVENVGAYAFNQCGSIETVSFPDSLTEICERAFYQCTKMTSFNMPQNIEYFGQESFYDCRSLGIELVFPESVIDLGARAFQQCRKIDSVDFSKTSIEKINASLFCKSYIKTVVFPETLKSIMGRAFENCSFSDLTFPQSLETIGNESFSENYNLKTVKFPGSLESIGSRAFYRCTGLTTIDFTEAISLTKIDSSAFRECRTLESVKFPDNLISIGEKAFCDCSKLTTVEFNNTLESIGGQAFYQCDIFPSVVLPDSLKFFKFRLYSFGYGTFSGNRRLESVFLGKSFENDSFIRAFSYCSKLAEINVSEENVKYSSTDGVVYNKEKTKLVYCPPAKAGAVSVPNTVEVLTHTAIKDSPLITDLNVEPGGEYISSVDGIVYSADKKKVICCPMGKEGAVNIADGAVTINAQAFDTCRKITDITFPDTLSVIGKTAFYGCSKLNFESLSKNLKEIGEHAFGNCSGITNLVLPESLVTVDLYAFYGCSGLKSLVFSSEIKNWSSRTFEACSNLESVELLASIKTIPSGTFENCRSLKNVSLGNALERIGSDAFKDCRSLVEIQIPESVSNIYDGAFDGCSSLTKINLPSSLKAINSETFKGCSVLPEIKIPESVTAIGSAAFSCCFAMTEISLPDSVASIGASAFSGCKNLSTVNFPEGLTQISVSAFANCKLSGELTLPDSIEYLGENCFYNNDITRVSIGKNCSEILSRSTINGVHTSENAFNCCSSLTNIEISDENPYLTSVDGVVYSKDKKKLVFCPQGREGSLDVLDSVVEVECGALCGSEKLTSLHLSDSITCFGQCRDSSPFERCMLLETVNIPLSLNKIEKNKFSSIYFKHLTFTENVQSISSQVWKVMETLTFKNRYTRYLETEAPAFLNGCTIRAYCGSAMHELAVKRLLNFESLGHTYLNWYTVAPATYESEGRERRDCAYCNGYEERTIPKLQKDTFSATFVADGKIVSVVEFQKGTEKITEPAVPAKDRYIGSWEDYTLSDSDITINAKYALIKSENASEIETKSDITHYTDTDDVLFRLSASSDAKVVKSTVSKSVPLDIALLVDQSGSMDKTLGGSETKVEALKAAANKFIASVSENAKLTGADHRISIIGFGLSGDYQGYEKNENTELLTSKNGAVRYDKIKPEDYSSSLIFVNSSGAINPNLTAAVNNIDARGATAADLGFEMVKGVFANTDSTDRQRIVVFMTDGEPTYFDGFQTDVANSAIANSRLLKTTYGATVYSVGVFSNDLGQNRNVNTFMNAVSSAYPEAYSLRYLGTRVDGDFYTTVNNTDSLSSVFKSISTEALSHTAPFDNLTLIKTLSNVVTLTSQQEQQLRIDVIRKFGVTNDDIIVAHNDNGTTTIKISNLKPEEIEDENGNIKYVVSVEFFASLNENAAEAGEYIVDTEDSGVMLGEDSKGYEATFDTSKLATTKSKTRIIFKLNGEVYEISENIVNGYAVAPVITLGNDWIFENWNVGSIENPANGTVFEAVLTKVSRTITWHTASGDITQTYKEGDFIIPPEVSFDNENNTFLSWDRSIPTVMPDENLEFTAVYGGHIHNYISAVTKKVGCETDGEMTYTCSCGESYKETIAALGHDYEAITPSVEKNDGKCVFACNNCGNRYEYALNYEVVKASGKRSRVLYEFKLTDDNLDVGFEPDGAINIRVPLSDYQSNARGVRVVRTNPDKSKTTVPARIENGFLVITTDHFSPYEVKFDVVCENHVPSEWIVDTDSTCTQEGRKHKICEECGETIATGVIEKKEHSYTEVVIEPTCTEPGTRVFTCSVCNESYSKTIPAVGHIDADKDGYCDSCGVDLEPSSHCSHICHSNNGFSKLIWAIINLFNRIFKSNQTCSCGVKHY